MSFNQMRRDLEDAASREARIRELAENLQRRGLAMTRESARQLAISMVETERKVQKRYQEQKEKATSYNDPRSKNESFDKRVESEKSKSEEERGFLYNVDKERAVDDNSSDKSSIGNQGSFERREPAGPVPSVEYPELKPSMTVSEAVEESEESESGESGPAKEGSEEVGIEEAEEYPLLGSEADSKAKNRYVESGDEDLGVASDVSDFQDNFSSGQEESVSKESEENDEVGEEVGREVEEDQSEPLNGDGGEDGREEDEERGGEKIEEDSNVEDINGEDNDDKSAPRREDLGKKHGIDISNIFNVNK